MEENFDGVERQAANNMIDLMSITPRRQSPAVPSDLLKGCAFSEGPLDFSGSCFDC
jgi:hypothetical protein